jgi:Beta-ketoacyl synthase, N-terminal domain
VERSAVRPSERWSRRLHHRIIYPSGNNQIAELRWSLWAGGEADHHAMDLPTSGDLHSLHHMESRTGHTCPCQMSAPAEVNFADRPTDSYGRGQLSEPIAAVGMAGRFPGAGSVEGLRELLREGTDAIRDVPPERWDADVAGSVDHPLSATASQTRLRLRPPDRRWPSARGTHQGRPTSRGPLEQLRVRRAQSRPLPECTLTER